MYVNQFHLVKSPELCSALQALFLLGNTQRDMVAGPASQLLINNLSLYLIKVHKNITTLINFGIRKFI